MVAGIGRLTAHTYDESETLEEKSQNLKTLLIISSPSSEQPE